VITSGNATIEDSTISGNRATTQSGGGIALGFGNLIVTGSTISGNSASDHGGGIYLSNSNLIVRHSTITGNQSGANGGFDLGGGIAVTTYSGTNLDHTIVAGNFRGAGATRDDVGVDFSGGAVLAAYSLIGDNTGTSLVEAPVGSPDANGNLIGGPTHGAIDPRLDLLADNGGPTWTHALLSGSPAINAGDPAAVAGAGNVPLYDQRGAPFTRVQGGRIDIGTVELQQVGPALPGDYNQSGTVDAADYVVWRKTLGTIGLSAYSGADGDGDGMVDQDDHGVWRANLAGRCHHQAPAVF
jgi:parallel beta-helix repeat protein